MQWNDHTNICTYRVREGARSEFVELLRKHWPALRDAGLATETPAIHFEAVPSGKKEHGETGITFVEIFSWAKPDSAELAHQLPSVMAVWEPMGALVEARDGRPSMEFHRFQPLDLSEG